MLTETSAMAAVDGVCSVSDLSVKGGRTPDGISVSRAIRMGPDPRVPHRLAKINQDVFSPRSTTGNGVKRPILTSE